MFLYFLLDEFPLVIKPSITDNPIPNSNTICQKKKIVIQLKNKDNETLFIMFNKFSSVNTFKIGDV
jgi:hypothetical protein